MFPEWLLLGFRLRRDGLGVERQLEDCERPADPLGPSRYRLSPLVLVTGHSSQAS